MRVRWFAAEGGVRGWYIRREGGGGGWEQGRVIKRKGGAVGTTVERECYTDQESSTFEVSGFERRLKRRWG